jgi:hypothetical protein
VTYYFSSLKEETKSKRIEMDTHPLTQWKINRTTLHICITNQASSYKQFNRKLWNA